MNGFRWHLMTVLEGVAPTSPTADAPSIPAIGVALPGWLLGWLVTMVVAGLVAVIAYTFLQRNKPRDQAGTGLTRTVLAIALVGALILLTGASFYSSASDAQTRNLLVGGLVASSSAAVAFYFASRTAQEARQDLLSASLGAERVPHLIGSTPAQAQALVSRSSLALNVPNGLNAIVQQSIPAGTLVSRGTVIVAN